jgi:hypothetical protein
MNSRQKIVVALVVSVLVCGASVAGYLIVNSLNHSGEQAVALMNAEERQWLERIGQIRQEMDTAEVHAVFGEPTSDIILLAKWDGFAGSKLSQLRIYFSDGHPTRILWFKLGSFMYERDIPALR